MFESYLVGNLPSHASTMRCANFTSFVGNEVGMVQVDFLSILSTSAIKKHSHPLQGYKT